MVWIPASRELRDIRISEEKPKKKKMNIGNGRFIALNSVVGFRALWAECRG